MAVLPRARRFTVAEYERMVEAGVFRSSDRVGLIEGEIIEMTPIGDPHASVVDRLAMLMSRLVGHRAIVRMQGPVRFIRLHSRPQPDLVLLAPRADYDAGGAPGTREIFLLIEVMDTSVEYDRRRKTPLYARARVPEVWLVDIPAGVVDVHRNPGEGGYRNARTVTRGETLRPQAFSDVTLSVDDILG
ncbi:MAG TPA: Uma2 family endonuclease [Methylomirabilota bacterium]